MRDGIYSFKIFNLYKPKIAMEGKQYVTGITEDGLSKMINPEEHFKYSNWVEWLENEK
jgi:hypothetical protein